MTCRQPLRSLLLGMAVVGLVAGLSAAGDTAAETQTRSPEAGISESELTAMVKRLEVQVDEILQVQQAILASYDELMEELRIVKVRVSR